jgi:uncharacterized protein (TIGR03067 family)
MPRRTLLVVSLSLLVGFAPAPFPRPRRTAEKDDLQRIQGTWEVIQYERGGSDLLRSYKEVRIAFEGGRMTFHFDGRIGSRWDFVLEPASRPRALTRTHVGSKGRVARGIYRFEGDRLILCDHHSGPRPTEFDSKGNHYLIVLRRR